MSHPTSPLSLEQAASILKSGGLVGLPTETVYGLGANALDPVAVAKIFAAKERPFFDPLIVHIPDIDWVPRVARVFPPLARKLAQHFWPGPLTLVLPKSDIIPDLVTSGLPGVGVRIPAHDMTRQVMRLADIPVAAPSANPFGKLSPTTAEHVFHQLGDRVDAILDGGPCRIGIESTVLRVDDDRVTLLRYGGISLEEIEDLIGPIDRLVDQTSHAPAAAPGMLTSHYAPRTPLIIADNLSAEVGSGPVGLLTLGGDGDLSRFSQVEVLSPSGDLVTAAANFFQALHRLDRLNLRLIVARRFPDKGLGRALNDRLKRAAHQEPDTAGP